jgi:hypothetical protein
MVNVIIYIVAAISCSVQVYAAFTHNLWWTPNDPLPTVALVGVVGMMLGAAWGAVKGTSAAWIVFFSAMLCWAFYIPGLGNLIGSMRQQIMEGRLSFADIGVYLPLLPPIFLTVATIQALMVGPMGKTDE